MVDIAATSTLVHCMTYYIHMRLDTETMNVCTCALYSSCWQLVLRIASQLLYCYTHIHILVLFQRKGDESTLSCQNLLSCYYYAKFNKQQYTLNLFGCSFFNKTSKVLAQKFNTFNIEQSNNISKYKSTKILSQTFFLDQPLR